MKELLFTSRAERDLNKLDSSVKNTIIDRLQKFRQDKTNAIPLAGGWKNWFKIRVGSYRILLMKKNQQKWVVGYIRHRREVYRN